MKFIRPSENSVLLCKIPKGIQLPSRLRLGLSHLSEHQSKYNLQDTLNPVYNCGENIKTSCH